MSSFHKLPRSFYLRPTLQVARDLLGKVLVLRRGGRTLAGKIVETEAYRGKLDPASHAFRGKTKRNEVMFWNGGHLYVYFTYGMHFCANVVTQREGIGEAVLIRAIEPLEGIDVMVRNRLNSKGDESGVLEESLTRTTRSQDGSSDPPPNLTNGPAKLCQAFAIGRSENGTDLLGNDICIASARPVPRSQIGSSTRIGIRKGRGKKWRFFVKGSNWVSR